MNVVREIAQQLAIPAAMILLGVLIWTESIGDTAAIAVFAVLITVTAFRLGRISTALWPRH